MRHAPLTDSRFESRNAQLDVRVKVSRGSAPIQTISDKQVVSPNKYLLTGELPHNKPEMFKWARISSEAK